MNYVVGFAAGESPALPGYRHYYNSPADETISRAGPIGDGDNYHPYLMNLTRREFFLAELAKVYRCRWEIELLFYELKTQYYLDEFDTSNEHVVTI